MSTNITVSQNLAVLAQETEPSTTGLVLQCILYGAYALLFPPTIRAIIKRRPRSRPWIALLITSIIMFAMSTVCLLLEVINTMGLFHGILLETRGGANDRTLAQAAIFSMEFMLGDGVVVWRAAALWGYNWACMAIMLLPLVGDLGQSEWWYIAGTQAKQCNESQRALFLLSFSTNFIATGFIAAKAWQHRGAFKARPASLSHPGKSRRTPAQKIMLLLVESGFMYLVYWGLASPAYFMTNIFNSIRYQVVGIYPTALIYLVQCERTSWSAPELVESLRFKAATREKPDETTEGDTTVGSVPTMSKYETVGSYKTTDATRKIESELTSNNDSGITSKNEEAGGTPIFVVARTARSIIACGPEVDLKQG
ncbi:hypothetical protein BD626DRAFT_549511 [Schizophyllum amplum]|uniref:Uncharacterized protein n=1 Tax=Schizophyllum amplum TaxID=97359 RepID=A0A550C7P6_9AGAR|nr:hypothetical protein BD626DRAFT_549511 [Auriculariopsis ampla]